MTAAHRALLAPGIVEREILVLRGHRVLDEQLAPMYGVQVNVLNRAVKRNEPFLDASCFSSARRKRNRPPIAVLT